MDMTEREGGTKSERQRGPASMPGLSSNGGQPNAWTATYGGVGLFAAPVPPKV